MSGEGSSSTAEQCSDEITMNLVTPLSECSHLEQVNDHLPAEGISSASLCSVCRSDQEIWVCLTCFAANCGRYVLGHGTQHWKSTGHSMAISLCDLSVWCYDCDAYVHNQKLIPAKNLVHLSKFGTKMPSSDKL